MCQIFWEVIRCPLVNVYQCARRHIPEDFDIHQYRCEKLKTRTEVRIFIAFFVSTLRILNTPLLVLRRALN